MIQSVEKFHLPLKPWLKLTRLAMLLSCQFYLLFENEKYLNNYKFASFNTTTIFSQYFNINILNIYILHLVYIVKRERERELLLSFGKNIVKICFISNI